MEELQEALDMVPEALAQLKRMPSQSMRNTGAQKHLQSEMSKTWKLEKERSNPTAIFSKPIILGMTIVGLMALSAFLALTISGSIRQQQHAPPPVQVDLTKQQLLETKMSQESLHKMDDHGPNEAEDMETIYITNKDQQDNDLAEEVSKHPNAKRMIIDRAHITDEGLQVIESLPLNELVLQRMELVSDKGIAVLKNFPNLTKLGITNCPIISDKGLESLRLMNKLQAVDLSADPDVTDKTISYLPKTLGMLNLKGDQISGKGCAQLGQLTKLTTLDLSFTAIVNDDLKHLQSLNKLTFLALAGTSVSDAGMKYITKISSLERIILAGTPITKRGIYELAHLPHLRLINIRGCNFVKIGDVDNLLNKTQQPIMFDQIPHPQEILHSHRLKDR